MDTCGIDVDSRELKVVVRKKGKNGKVQTFKNNALEHQKLANMLRNSHVGRVCIEATGVYHIDLAVVLSETPGLEVMVLNPRVARRFAQALSERQKTDKVDAQVLAEFAERMPFVAWEKPRDELLSLRVIARRLSALTSQRTQAKNQRHAAKASQRTPAIVIEDIELSIRQLETQIRRLHQAALDLMADDEQLMAIPTKMTVDSDDRDRL